ncbi:MAG: bifunctional homocysteine S-methyltransferase/methylenetetrahydrofolate reductase [Myxococcota bacterium]
MNPPSTAEPQDFSPGRGAFRDFLNGEGVALFDGAMGTMFYQRGVFVNRAFEELNLTEPGLVREVHTAYVEAGADIIETNTFSANRFRLQPFGLGEQVSEINKAAVQIAREASDGRAWVAGAMGPLGVRIEPFGKIATSEARAVFAEQAKALCEAGVDLLILETFSHLPELEEALAAAKSVTAIPLVAQITVASGGLTREGVPADEVARRLEAAGADVVGVNCSEPLAGLDALLDMQEATTLPLVGQPNAGQPRSIGGRNMYLATPEYLVAWSRRAVRNGARLIGGCCGTTPEHIRAMRATLGEPPSEIDARGLMIAREHATVPAAEAVERAQKSVLASTLARGEFVRGVGIPAPLGWDSADVIQAVRKAALGGASFVSFAEGSTSRAHLPPAAMAQVSVQAGIEAVVYYSCRGRRLVRMQTELLGHFSTGITNIVLVTGSPLTAGAEQDAWPELEVDSIGAVNLADRLNHGEDIGGNPIGKPTGLHVGVRLDPTAFDKTREISRLGWKTDAGAEFGVTAPVFDPVALASLLDHVDGTALPVIATIWPLRSARETEFFEQRAASVPVPPELIARMSQAEADGRESEEGVAIAVDLIRQIAPMVQGIQVVAPGGDISRAVAVLNGLRT